MENQDGQSKLSHIQVYGKWQGAHWTMATLADIGYPPADSKATVYCHSGVPVMQGRFRRCASQQADAPFVLKSARITI